MCVHMRDCVCTCLCVCVCVVCVCVRVVCVCVFVTCTNDGSWYMAYTVVVFFSFYLLAGVVSHLAR